MPKSFHLATKRSMIVRCSRLLCRGIAFSQCFSIMALVVIPPDALRAADEKITGQQIFQARCAECHGPRGEGVTGKYPQPLTGELSLPELTDLIHKTMPPEPRPKIVEAEARDVAQFVFTEFYARGATSAHRAPRIQLSRLTARQYRYAIADIMTSFRGSTGPWDDQRGLKGSYNTTAPNGEGKHVFERLDPTIDFDFGMSSPDPEKFDPREFSMMWSGSLRAPVTGEYEIIVRSENSVDLWINDRVNPLINAWVKSGDEKEFRGSVRLLAGHGYPVQLNYSKSGQGVRKSAEEKAKEPIAPASLHISWIPPGQTEEIIPKEFWSPHHFPESYYVMTTFPPDDHSTGFERGSSVSREWDQATTDAALEVADYVGSRLNDLSGGAQPGPDYESRLREFARQFTQRAFRRPLTSDEIARYVDRQFQGASDPEVAIYKVVLLALKSPHFLYQRIGEKSDDQHARAARLAFALWDAPPDTILLSAAAAGKLATREEIAEHAERMSRHPLGRFKLREFFWQWTKLDQVRELEKSTDQFPGFDAAASHDLRRSLELFLDEMIASEQGTFDELLLAESLYLNGRLSKIYGGGLPETAPFQPVKLEGGHRAGLLTHPYLMSALADSTTTSPIRRGVFVARGILGRPLLPPPDAVTLLAPSLHPDLNTRERVVLQTQGESCRSCHSLINPLGFPLENFDAIGKYRNEDNQRPVDPTGEYTTRKGATTRFVSARELAAYLSQSPEAHAALVEKLFYFAVQQPVRAYGDSTAIRLQTRFQESRRHLRTLFREIGVMAALGPQPDQPSRPNKKNE